MEEVNIIKFCHLFNEKIAFRILDLKRKDKTYDMNC